ncbi:uncharacterized protein RJT21DRAFT_5034 [Scheffersomyces amazonensis]|uniref:uncharacterized protein n=1 Tax=Scheffersomyces amazonensis TaxID=1078765 RepID=UPI00315D0228
MIATIAASAMFLTGALAEGEEVKKAYYQYTYEELNSLTIFQRALLNDWRLEGFTLAFITLFVLLFLAGDIYNKRLVVRLLENLKGSFEKNFYQYGVNPNTLYIKDSSENYSSYATGRVNIAKVNILFKLKPRHNSFVWILETILSFFTVSVPYPTDRVDFVITPSSDAEYDNFIAAIVSKIGMNDYRKLNYFLSLTKTSDSPNLPQSFVYMSEANEFQEKITTPDLKKALTLESASFIRYLAVTDQPAEHPESLHEMTPRRKIILSTDVTSNVEQIKQIGRVLEALFQLVDKLAAKEISFKAEAVKKVVKTRDLEIAKLQKIEEEIKQEKLADEKAKLKREERDKLRNSSKDEQLKAEKRAQERRARKQQKKLRA